VPTDADNLWLLLAILKQKQKANKVKVAANEDKLNHSSHARIFNTGTDESTGLLEV